MSLLLTILNFLDVSNFLAAGTSLDKWLKAYKCEVQKAIFPYEWLDDYNKLNSVRLPFYQRWFSSLKNKNISIDDYIQALKTEKVIVLSLQIILNF